MPEAKKYVLIIVEGLSDKTALQLGISKFLVAHNCNNKIGFDVFRGDFTLHDKKGKPIQQGAVEDNIRDSLDAYFADDAKKIKPQDIVAIATISDLDGVYCTDEQVIQDEKIAQDGPRYDLSKHCIYCRNVPKLISRNEDKRESFSALQALGNDPFLYKRQRYKFRAFYFGITMEHALHGRLVYEQEEKCELAKKFRKSCEQTGYLENTLASIPAYSGCYEESWNGRILNEHCFDRITNVQYLLDWVLEL